MHLDVSEEIESLINKRLSTGAYASAEEVPRSALNAMDADEIWQNEERQAWVAHIEEGYRQAERGELMAGAAARLEIEAMKDSWRSSSR